MSTSEYVNFFRSSSPYIHAHRGKTFVIAFGGEAVEHQNFHNIIHDIALLHSLGIKIILVHGARPQIDESLIRYGITAGFHQQLRITDPDCLNCVKEAAGKTRIAIEAEFSMGLPNSPMHGAQIRVVGGNFIAAKPVGIRDGIDFQHTGEIRKIDTQGIRQQLDLDALVLFSPIGYSTTGEVFNLNYQDLATETAIALKAEKLILMDSHNSLLNAETGKLVRSLSTAEIPSLAAQQTNEDTQHALVSAQLATSLGVNRTHIISIQHDGSLLSELFTLEGSGTLVTTDNKEVIREATIDDVGGILELISPLEEQGVLVKRSRELLETEISQFFVVVHPEGMLLGCAALYPFPDQQSGELACVATRPDFKGRGIATQLLEAIESSAKQEGFKQLFVLTTQTAHWFMEKGFVPRSLDALPEEKQTLYNYQRNSKIFAKSL